MKYDSYENEFLDAVCSWVKSRSAHPKIRKELHDHIYDQKQAYIAKGICEEEAVFQAIREMGDPHEIGKELHLTHKPLVEWSVLLAIGIFVIIGGVMQYLYMHLAPGTIYAALNLFGKFLFYAPIGLSTFLLAYFFNYAYIRKYPWQFYIGYLIMISFLLLVSPVINGAPYYPPLSILAVCTHLRRTDGSFSAARILGHCAFRCSIYPRFFSYY